MTKTLYIEDVHAAYYKKEVLHGVSLKVAPGEIVVLIGPNGAGKSTVLKVAAGFLEPNSGHVSLGEQELTGRPPHERTTYGLSYCIQGGRVFSSLTVAENLEMGAQGLNADARQEGRNAVLELFPNLKLLLDRRAGVLSGGERQALALGMVLLRRPQVLLLDEPSAGLSPKFVSDLLERVGAVNEMWGTAILLVEQNVHAALHTAHRAMALINGEVAHVTREPESWLASGELEGLFFGTDAQNRQHTSSRDHE